MKFRQSLLFIGFLVLTLSACKDEIERPTGDYIPPPSEENNDDDPNTGGDLLPDIDLSGWKVTLPIGDPTEVHPPEILDYANNSLLKDFMYNDGSDGSLVFYTYPGASTANSSYSRTELRELLPPYDGKTNWTFPEGGRMKGTLKMDEISKDDDGDYHRTIIMQIHGRLTDEQRDLIGEDDNNAPPMLKIYWRDGYVRVHTKVLNDLDATYEEMLETSAWGNATAVNFDEYVGFEPFTLEVIASDGRMEITLNDEQTLVYDDIHMEKWNVFTNYFKAGNYLSSQDPDAFARVKYYDLEVSH